MPATRGPNRPITGFRQTGTQGNRAGRPSRLRLALFAVIIAATAGIATAQSMDVVMSDLEGTEHRLSDLRGKWLVMNFWATWCPPCIKEMPELEAFHQQHKDHDAVVWGVTFEDTPKEEVAAFVERLGVTYPILGHGQDPYTPFGQVRVLPTTFLINPEGLLERSFLGPVTAVELEEAIAR